MDPDLAPPPSGGVVANEPVVTGGVIQGLIAAVAGLVVAFGHLTATQQGAIATAVLAVIAAVTAWQRSRVSPVKP